MCAAGAIRSRCILSDVYTPITKYDVIYNLRDQKWIHYIDENGVDVIGKAVALKRRQIRPEIVRC